MRSQITQRQMQICPNRRSTSGELRDHEYTNGDFMVCNMASTETCTTCHAWLHHECLMTHPPSNPTRSQGASQMDPAVPRMDSPSSGPPEEHPAPSHASTWLNDAPPRWPLYACVICRQWSFAGSFTDFQEDSLIVQAGWISEGQPPFMCRICYLLNAVHSQAERMPRNGRDEETPKVLLQVLLEWLSYTMREETY